MRLPNVAAWHRGIVGLGVVMLVSASFVGAGSAPVKAAPAITFGTPIVMDPIHNVGEPTIVRSPAQDNTVYASGPWGTGTQRSIWDASVDSGETFRIVNQCNPTTSVAGTESCQSFPPGTPPSALVGNASPPGGGDTDQRLDHNGKDYFADLWALACDRVATTTNSGATAPQNAYGCNSPSVLPTSRPDGSDRQWLAVFDPLLTGVTSTAADSLLAPLTYMEYNNLQTVQTGCSYWVKSTNGLNYTPANNDNGNFGCDGYPAVDQTTGVVLETSGCNTNSVCLNIGVPDASGNLCFLDDPAVIMIGGVSHACAAGGGNAYGNSIITVASGLAGDPNLLFTVASIDTGRNLHVTFAINGSVSGSTSTYQVFTTVANAGTGPATAWHTWATPAQVSLSPANVNVFPWVVAGGPGRSDSVWYGTSSFIDPSTNGGQAWDVYMNQAVWPVDGSGKVTLAAPALNMVKVSPHPNHYNSICLLGTGCITAAGDRNLADFFTVIIDHNGAAEVEYNDTSNGLSQPGFVPPTPIPSAADHPGAPVVTIAHQDSGLGLFGSAVSGLPNEPSAAPTTGMVDPSGDAKYPVIGGANQSTFDFVNGPTTGNLANQLSLSGGTLTVKMNVVDLTAPTMATAQTTVTGASNLQYVTRWQMGNKIYYAMMETNASLRALGQDQFYAGPASSVDLCSVSACDPHVTQYPDVGFPASGNATGGVSCPVTPSVATPCTITITVNTANIGSPSSSSLLEEVGTYAFASGRNQSAETNANAEADQLPLEIDGICCFNFAGNGIGTPVPETPWSPALIGVGVLLIGAGAALRRRRAHSHGISTAT